MNTIPRVIIIGHNYMSRLSLARALGAIGCDVVDVCIYYGKPNKQLDFYSKYVTQYKYAKANEPEELITLLLSIKSEVPSVIIPCSDYAASTVDNHRDILRAYYYIPGTGIPGEVHRLMNKEVQKGIADSLGIKNAKCWMIDISDDGTYQIPKDIVYPCFPKASLSVSGGKVGMVKCSCEEELRNVISDLIKGNCMRVMVEQYLEIDKECALIGFSDGENVYIPGYLHLKQLAHGIHKGVAVAGDLLPNGDLQPIIDQYASFVKATHFVGLFDIDFFECQGACYFGEMNMRIGASCEAYIKNGFNIPAWMLNHFVGKKADNEIPMVTNAIPFVNERMVLLDWSSGYLTYREFKNMLNFEIGFLDSLEDPRPIQIFKIKVIILRVRKFIRKILRK